MRRIDRIEMTIYFNDGEQCQAMLSDEGIQRWGADKPILADAVDATEAMLEALQVNDIALS
jgi:hypothetical protein